MSLNFITCRDGFTLEDLVSHDQKHNEVSGGSTAPMRTLAGIVASRDRSTTRGWMPACSPGMGQCPRRSTSTCASIRCSCAAWLCLRRMWLRYF